MSVQRLRSAVLAIAATVTLAGCAYDSYGYGGVSVGYGNGYYGDGYYYDDYYDSYYGGGYYDSWYGGGPYYGWFNGFYYPGIGIYIYDRHGKRHRWNDHHRRHWEGRRGGRHPGHGNWSGYRGRPGSGSATAPHRQAPQARSWRQANPQRQIQRQSMSRQSPARVVRPSSTRGRSGRHN